MTDHIKWEIINAYVDGELSSLEAAEVARAVASDSGLAQQVATLSTLKASVAASSPQYDKNRFNRPKFTRRRVSSAAAVVLVLTGLLFVATAWHSDLFIDPPGIELAEAEHLNWLQSDTRTGPPQSQELVRIRLQDVRLEEAYVPDLVQVQLAFSGVRRVPARGGDGIHVGYLGPSGCSVSLVMFQRHGEYSETLRRIERGGRTVYAWRSEETVFYLLAHSMDPNRFEQVAATVYRLTRQRLPLDSQSMIALNQARSSSQPCVA